MDASEYRRLSQIENRHWWFRAIHSLIVGVFKGPTLSFSRSDLKRPLRILDAGCGTGGLTEKLVSAGTVVGLDISSQALSYAREKSLVFIQGSVNNLPFRDESFDVITSISLLYHKRVDDGAAWAEMRRVSRPGGIAIVVLPAFPWLTSHHDRLTHAKRRYTLPHVMQDVSTHGFEVLDGRYLFSLLFPIFFIKRVTERLGVQLASDVAMPPRWLNVFLERTCLFEWRFARFLKFPFGSSLLLVVRKVQ